MNTIILDADLKAKLRGGTTTLDITDEAGNPVGHYLTHEEYMRLRYDLAKVMMSDGELEEARRDVRVNGGLTTAEVLQRLHELDRRLRGPVDVPHHLAARGDRPTDGDLRRGVRPGR